MVLVAGVGCASRSAGGDGASPELSATEPGNESAGIAWMPDAATPGADACAEPVSAERAVEVCRRWRCESLAAAAPARWSGDPTSCQAGELDDDAAARALLLVNLRRYLADLSPVTLEPAWAPAAGQCALLAHANAKLSHTPGSDWKCWSPTGALTSGVSLIANRTAPVSIAAYMEDPGNEATMVHRRWLLSESLEAIAFGSTDRYSCLVVDGNPLGGITTPSAKSKKNEARGWAAWPPAGPVPIELIENERLDVMGWTLQADSDALDHTSVTVTRDGQPMPVTVTHLTPLMGSRSALRFVPTGWTTQPGDKLHVQTTDGKIAYLVEPTGC